MSKHSHDVDQALRTTQIIVVALAMGVSIFLAMVLWIVHGQPAPPAAQNAPPPQPLITYVALAAVLPLFLMRFVVLRAVDAGTRRKLLDNNPSEGSAEPIDATVWLRFYQTRTIIAAAMIEGLTFFVIMAYMIERQWLTAVLAVLLLAMIVAHFPTRGRVMAWIESQTRAIEEGV